MKRIIQGLLLAGSLVVGGSALAQSTTHPAPKGGMVEHMGFKAPADEKALLERLHHVNQDEIQVGKLAQQNSQNPDVKSYGDMLVKDHTSADEKVMAYAKKKGLTLSMPKPLDEVERKAMAANKANLEKLQVLKNAPFDSSFLASMVGGHDMVLGKLMAAQQHVTDTGLKPLLQDLSQSVTQHRQKAYSLLGRIGPGANTGVGGSGDMNKDMGKGEMDKDIQQPTDKNTMDPGNPKKY